MPSIAFTVNGIRREVQAPGDTPLLYVLRNDLELSGPQFGCGLSQCGACSVLVDGKEARSCVLPVSRVAGKEVTTLEGLPGALGGPAGPAAVATRSDAAPGAAGVDRRAGAAVRLLPERHDDQGDRAARADARADGGADQERLHERRVAASLPLRQLLGDPRRRAARLDADGEGE